MPTDFSRNIQPWTTQKSPGELMTPKTFNAIERKKAELSWRLSCERAAFQQLFEFGRYWSPLGWQTVAEPTPMVVMKTTYHSLSRKLIIKRLKTDLSTCRFGGFDHAGFCPLLWNTSIFGEIGINLATAGQPKIGGKNQTADEASIMVKLSSDK